MTELPDEALSEMQDLHQDVQRANERLDTYLRGLLRGAGYDPETATVDLDEGVIRKQAEGEG